MTLQLKDMTLLKRQGWIDGQWVDADSGKVFAVTNPATGQTLVEVADMGAAETRRAIDAAARALPGWRGKTAKERAQVLRKWFDLIIAHTEDLAQLMTAEQGKPLAEARGEVAYGASFVEWFAEEAKRDPHIGQRPPPLGAQAADRRVRRDHPLELSDRNDHPQGGARPGRRLHGGGQAG